MEARILVVPAGHNDIEVDLSTLASSRDEIDEVAHLLLEHSSAQTGQGSLWTRLVAELWRAAKTGAGSIGLKTPVDIAELALGKLPRTHEARLPLHCMLVSFYCDLMRAAPRQILASARHDKLTRDPASADTHDGAVHANRPSPPDAPLTKDWYAARADWNARQAHALAPQDLRTFDARLALAVARQRLDDANELAGEILRREPTNALALFARARALFAKRQFRPALRAYQHLLQLAARNTALPDPRIGLGLCCYMLGDRPRAQLAWRRALKLADERPGAADSHTPALLLALAALNESRDQANKGGHEARSAAYARALELVQPRFKAHRAVQRHPVAALVLAQHFLARKDWALACKLAERACQFAATRASSSEAHVLLARALHGHAETEHDAAAAAAMIQQARQEYTASVRANPDQVLAQLALAQLHFGPLVARLGGAENYAAALDAVENGVLKRLPRCVEALAIQGALRTQRAFLGFSSLQDSGADRRKAKDAYDALVRIFTAAATTAATDQGRRVSAVANDWRPFAEMARLWFDDPKAVGRVARAYREALRNLQEERDDDDGDKDDIAHAQVTNNLGVLEFVQQDPARAAERFEDALTLLAPLASGALTDELDALLTTLTYNLGVAYDAHGEHDRASDAFRQITQRHPEHVEAKARLALMAMARRDLATADVLVKEALSADGKHLDLRALYTYYLVQARRSKDAFNFATATLKEVDRRDTYALCAAGALQYADARELKPTSSKASADRRHMLVRAAELFDRALAIDPHCAVAAQGAAILIAEGHLESGGGAEDAAVRSRNARDAFAIFSKVADATRKDGSVYVNIGHCHMQNGEWDDAIAAYETADARFFHGGNVQVLLCLARSLYHKAMRLVNAFATLKDAVGHAERALVCAPGDLAILYDIAILKQKALETLLDTKPEKRTLAELKAAVVYAQDSNRIFGELEAKREANKNLQTPYQPPNLPSLRKQYGEKLVSDRAPEQLTTQEEYEETEQAKVLRARQAREQERERARVQEENRLAELQRKADELANQRKKLREEALTWTMRREGAGADGEDEPDDKPRKKKAPAANGGGKKRKGTAKKKDESPSSSEDEARTSPPASKKRKLDGSNEPAAVKDEKESEDDDEDDDDMPSAKPKRRSNKQFKSAEFVESESDE